MKTATLWQFLMIRTGSAESWTWRRTGPDGSIDAVSIGHHANYGEIVYDAIRHGFHPKQQQWIVTDGGFSSHYFPDGRSPVSGGSASAATPRPDPGSDGQPVK